MQERWRRHINTGCGSIPVCVSHEAERWLCFPASPNKDKCCGGCRQGRRGGEKEDRDGEMDTEQAAASPPCMCSAVSTKQMGRKSLFTVTAQRQLQELHSAFKSLGFLCAKSTSEHSPTISDAFFFFLFSDSVEK